MSKLKRLITPVIAALLLCTPLMGHADSSANSVTDLYTEGNVQCRDYGPNSVILSMDTSSPSSSGTLSGPDNLNDGAGGETGTYEIINGDTLNFTSSTPIDYAVLKASRDVQVFWYAKGGINFDNGMSIQGNPPISAFSLCYGLGNVPDNAAPVLASIDDKTVTYDFLIEFGVTASDDGLPKDPGAITLTAATLPAGASFTDNGDGTGTFSWIPTADDVGIHDITFTASDGLLEDTETISITVKAGTPACENLSLSTGGDSTSGLPILDKTGVVCPATGTSLVCNFELGQDKETFGIGDGSDVCCVCNNGATNEETALRACDRSAEAGTIGDSGLPACTLTAERKLELVNDGKLRETEVPTLIQLNNDPYYCYDNGFGGWTCFIYPPY